MTQQATVLSTICLCIYCCSTSAKAYDVFQDNSGFAERLPIPNEPLQVHISIPNPATGGAKSSLDYYEFYGPGDLTVTSGAGDNDISVVGPIDGDVTIIAGEGGLGVHDLKAGDLVINKSGRGWINLFTHVMGNTEVNTTEKAAPVEIRNATFEGDLSIATGRGRDSIYIGESMPNVGLINPYANNCFYGRTTIDTGGDHDVSRKKLKGQACPP